MKTRYLVVLSLAMGVLSATSQADTAALDTFMAEVNAFSARFEQTLYDADGDSVQTSSGTVVLERPARFRWEYSASDSDASGQTLVADGERVWLYDPDLEQVTVNRIDERVAGTPLVVLMGNDPLESVFAVESLGNSDGIDWFELAPISQVGDFDAVFVGLADGDLAAMELRDSFGQATQILFSEFDADIDPEDALFTFVAPEGVDIIGAE